ncbi:MAG TPA: class I adenylate-forming enzyme family protein, partial [Usitatibacter sp.]|nr:class I adenylate-forming enzyme family protein [Usitatibacter sp.]
GERVVDYGALDAAMDRVAARLQAAGAPHRRALAICAPNSIEYVEVFFGALRAGMAAAPISPALTPDTVAAMAIDSGAPMLFVDAATDAALGARVTPPRVRLEAAALGRWLAPYAPAPAAAPVAPDWPFNIIYSSGTTGEPKGIVQPHSMRWAHVQRGAAYGYGSDCVTLVSTPLYSNTTLVAALPTFALGGTAVLMEKFEPAAFLALAERHRVTHAMLVPVQYRRILEHPEFGRHDLSSFRMKFSTSAPFAPALKAAALDRWPGGLVEYYGMTEGGGTCVLVAHEHRGKLHTVGRPAPGHDIRVIDERGRELARGATGEVVGRSPAMMTGYHNRPERTAESEWFDAEGRRFIRTGDVGRFDADGFLVLVDRRKDVIISGGFNVYPSDLEAVVASHPAVAEAAVAGVPSAQWGETPVAFVVAKPGAALEAGELLDWCNARLGKVQRLSAVERIESLPRSAIGKVLKRELREAYAARVRPRT